MILDEIRSHHLSGCSLKLLTSSSFSHIFVALASFIDILIMFDEVFHGG